jgi:hypothetical protein
MNQDEYGRIIRMVRSSVATAVSPTSTVAVVSKGDDSLLDLPVARVWHFPTYDGGGYAGSYPATSEDAIRAVEAARAKGVNYLIFPAFAFWWLDHYGELALHLARSGESHRDDACRIFCLQAEASRKREPHFTTDGSDYLQQHVVDLALAILRPNSSVVFATADGSLPTVEQHSLCPLRQPARNRAPSSLLPQVVQQGARYLVIPASELAWTSVDGMLSDYLTRSARCLADRPGIAVIYELASGA